MSRPPLAALIGGAVGVVVLVGIVVLLVWFCLLHNRSVSRTSENGSSDSSIQAGRSVGAESSQRGRVPLPSDSREATPFVLEELGLATKNFSDINLIGQGKFGEVYKGLLHDGMIVAIKKRYGPPSQEFIEQVHYLSSIRHRNVVNLLGYCQENDQQMLVYEYIPSGSVSSHLYGVSQPSSEKLEFKHRLSIALEAAKGLAYLHGLTPPLIHKDFTTTNVLVDENFIAKVADAGLRNLLSRIEAAGPSSQMMADNAFLDPEVREYGRFSEKSDVYSFGVFLLELAQSYQDASNIAAIIDPRLSDNFTAEGIKDFIHLTAQCMNPSSERRPNMNNVVTELDHILEREMSLTTVMGEGTPTVTLGSQLFTASR
ncbi:probable leucine-rich repeat receptor-like protein kinase At5g49770 isoform X2 [Magnolia sinica]|uniref:probable leucine-rich repeat receptor-like protein kinase At5g49770 isoform X2 n=1 Tax=Magnolia sinica TaxID=86752 RepID=UPI00265B379B|nr:probable leucine-rich repeat receptor-like protein kinase At5g49770 isoform X2 [Magnolia sinica]